MKFATIFSAVCVSSSCVIGLEKEWDHPISELLGSVSIPNSKSCDDFSRLLDILPPPENTIKTSSLVRKLLGEQRPTIENVTRVYYAIHPLRRTIPIHHGFFYNMVREVMIMKGVENVTRTSSNPLYASRNPQPQFGENASTAPLPK